MFMTYSESIWTLVSKQIKGLFLKKRKRLVGINPTFLLFNHLFQVYKTTSTRSDIVFLGEGKYGDT